MLEAVPGSCENWKKVTPLLEVERVVAVLEKDFGTTSCFEVRSSQACVWKSALHHCDKMPEDISFNAGFNVDFYLRPRELQVMCG